MISFHDNAAAAILRRWPNVPRVGLILGTGLGNLAAHLEIEAIVPYTEIPGFRPSTAPGHAGRVVCGRLAGAPLAVLDGRCHRYEGCSAAELAWPVQVLARLGAPVLIVTNASGGLNPKLAGGDVLVIEGHIDLMKSSRHTPCAVSLVAGTLPVPSAGVSENLNSSPQPLPAEFRFGTRSAPATFYDPALIELALATARRENFVAHRGVYVSLAGPNYETRAEYRFLRRIGGDAVGMSTVPEVLAAAECGLRVLALSIVTNVARPDSPRKTTAAEVVAIAERAEPNLRKIVLAVCGNSNRESS